MIISPCKSGNIDAPIYRFLKDLNVSIPVIAITWLENFHFYRELLKLYKYAIIDYCEYDWNWDKKETHIFGKNTKNFKYKCRNEESEWMTFDNFCADNPPALYFKRELLKKDATNTILPVEYPCFIPASPVQSREDFNARKIEIMHYWGHSNEARRIFQGNAYLHAVKEDITVIDNIYYAEKFLSENNRRYWATMHIPHFARLPIENVLFINGLAKLSLSLPGAGIKCFRHAESPVNSVMVMMEDDLAWSTEWIHGFNCIKIKHDIIPEVEEALRREDLYDIYLNGLETIDKYRVGNYLRHLENLINRI